MVLVQINFSFPVEMMGDALSQSAKELAESINLEPGFIAKIWIENSDTAESGGIYLFQDQIRAEQYVDMHRQRVVGMGATNIEVKYFQVNQSLSVLNNFPLDQL